MMFLLGALSYTICTRKAPPQALEARAWGGALMAFTIYRTRGGGGVTPIGAVSTAVTGVKMRSSG